MLGPRSTPGAEHCKAVAQAAAGRTEDGVEVCPAPAMCCCDGLAPPPLHVCKTLSQQPQTAAFYPNSLSQDADAPSTAEIHWAEIF